MAFFIWFKRKENKLALTTGAVVLAALIFSMAILPTAWGATTGNEQTSIEKPAAQTSANQKVARGNMIDRNNVYLLARVIEGEAANEPLVGKVAVGAVIVNRTQNPKFPHTIAGVIYQPDAFEAVSNGQVDRPLTPGAIKAAKMALSGDDPTGGALYYWNPAKPCSPWIWSRPIITQIGHHVFAR